MGYSERVCQLCGVSFNIGRIRRPDEPIEAAWDCYRVDVIEEDEADCEAEGCQTVTRMADRIYYHDGSFKEAREITEHLAGPDCRSERGYSGYRMSVDEMTDCTRALCIMKRGENWTPDPREDEDFVLEAEETWITGISFRPPDEFDVHGLLPPLHGVSETIVSNSSEFDPEWGIPIHPSCFDIFKRMSLAACGSVDIDGFYQLWFQQGDFPRFKDWKEASDVDMCNQQWYDCVKGTEYLAAHPLRVPALEELIRSCVYAESERSEVVFDSKTADARGRDPFAALPPELILMLLSLLSRRDVANLRSVSRSFGQLPQTYFHRLVQTEMPWVLWDLESVSPKDMNWHKLWCKLMAADGGAGEDAVARGIVSTYVEYDSSLKKGIALLSAEDREQLGELGVWSNDESEKKIPEAVRKQMQNFIDAQKAAGKNLPRSTEIKGLRNRRRIYGDVKEILRRMDWPDGLDPEDENESWGAMDWP